MATTSKYFVTSSTGNNYIDFDLDYGQLSLQGQEIVFTGSNSVDNVAISPGFYFDFTKSNGGIDNLYLTGAFSAYSVAAYTTSTVTLSRVVGDKTETLLFAKGTISNYDNIIFSDGTAKSVDLHTWAANPAAAPTLTSIINKPSTLQATIKAFALDSTGEIFTQSSPGINYIVTGSNAVDSVYIKTGSTIDATKLNGGVDLIYLTGNWADYIKNVSTSKIEFVNNTTGEHVTVAAATGASNDRLVFADGSVLSNDAKVALNANASVAITAITGYDANTVTPGLDSTPPTLTITSDDPVLNIGDTATITFTFTEDPGSTFIWDGTTGDVTVTGGTLGAISGSGLTRTATFTPTAGFEGTASITVAAGSYTDAAKNDGGAGTSPAITIDTLAPTLAITSHDALLSVNETATLTFTFSEAPSGFAIGDINATGGTVSGFVATADPKVYQATFAPTAGFQGNASITVDAGSYTDAASNSGGAGTTPTVAIDTLRPTADIVVTDTALKIGETSLVTITFNEAVSGFTNADLAVVNGTLSAVSSTDNGITWTATLTPTADITDTTNVITLTNTGVADAAGNTGSGSTNSNNYAIDTQAPGTTSVAVPAPANYGAGDVLNFSVQFNEAVTIDAQNPPTLNLTIGVNARTATYDSGTGADTLVFKYTVTNNDVSNGTLTINSLSGTLNDLAGNPVTNPDLNSIGSTAAVVVDGATSGSGIDGYLSGVTIFADNDLSGGLNSGDSVAITNATGGFKLYGASGPLVMYGGTDISTGLSFNVQYEAPAGYSVINPVSSLIRAVQENAGGTALTNDAAYTVVREAIYGATGGPSLTAIRSYDPFQVATNSASSADQIADAIAYQRVAAALATLVDITSEAMSALDLSDQRENSIEVFDALAARIASGYTPGTLWADLQDDSAGGFLANLVGSLATTATPTQLSNVVTLIGTATAAIADAGTAVGLTAIEKLTEITKVQLVAQDYLQGDLDSIFDGAAFGTDVDNADVGVVVPVQFNITADAGNAAVLEGQSGETPTLTFTVTRSNNVDVAATVNYQVSGGTELTGADFASGAIPSGELTFAVGETSKTITIQLAGNDIRQNDRPFMVTLVDPTGTASIPNPNAFASINDDDPFTPVVYLNGTADVAAGQATTITTVVDYYDPAATLTVTVTTSNATASAASTSGTLAQVNAWLAALTLNGTSGTTQGTLDISVSVDGRTGSASSALTIHNAPTQDLPATLTVTAGQAAAVAGVSVHDVDGDNLTVDLTATHGSLALGDNSNVAVVAISSGLQLTGSVADLNAALQTLSYIGAPGQSSGVITLASNDGDALTSDPSGSINVTIAAAAPTLTLPGSAAPVTVGVPSTVTGISVADSDSPVLSVTLAAGNGALQAVAGGAAMVTGNSSATLTVSGTSTDVNTTLAGLRYTATGAGPTLAVSVNDNDAATTDPTNVPVSLTVVENTAPAAGGDLNSNTVTEDTPATLHLTGFTLTDLDGTAPSAVRILSVTGGTLLDAGGNTIALGTTGSVLALNAGALDLQFTPDTNRDSAASISYVVVDPLVDTLNSAPSSITVPITPVNDAPVVSPASGSITYAENGTGMKVAATLTIADVDSPQMSGATVTITNHQAGDVLDASGLPASISASFNAGTGVLTLSGTATRSDYETALRLVKFSNTSDTPDTTPRAISIAVQDVAVSGEQASSIAAARTVNVVAVNDAPVIAGMPATPLAYAENAAPAAIVPDLIVTDADSANLARAIIAITSGYRSAEDVLSASGLPAGITATFDSTSGRLTLSGVATVVEYQAALRSVAYSNSSDNPSTHSRTVKLVAADSPDLVASALASRSITITPSADKPVVDLNGLIADGSNNAVTFVHALYPNGIAIAPNAHLGDVDSTQLSKLTVTLTNAQAGDSLSLSASAQAVATSSGIIIDTSVANQITFTGDVALTSYTNLLKGVLFKSSTAEVEANRTIEVVATDITGAALVSDTTTVTVTESTSPFAAIAAGSQTLTLTGNPGSTSATVNMPAMTVSTPAGNVAVAGDPIFTAVNVDATNATGVAVTVIGNTVNNTITGSAGNDVLMGGGGTDVISGGTGNDRITWQAGSTLDGGEGNDTLVVTGNFNLSAPGATLGGFEVIDASGAAAGISLTGDTNAQNLVGGNFNDTLKGGGGGDTLTGGLGKDVFDVSETGTTTGSAVTISDLALGDSIKLGAAPTDWNVQNVGGFNFLVFDGHYVNLGTTLPSDWNGWSLTGDTLSVVKVPTQTVAITAMTRDSGASASDFITNDGAARVVSGTLSAVLGANEVVQVSFDNGAIWTTANTTGLTWSVGDSGTHDANWIIQARVANTEANVHGTAASRVVTFDTQVDTLGLALANDTGSSNSDRITGNAAITTTGQEDGATVQYSSNGTVWGNSVPAPVQGSNTVYARQTDVAGNISTPASLTFTYDTQAPVAPTGLILAAGSDSGLAGDRLTHDTAPTLSGTAEAGSVVTLREGATVLGTATAALDGTWSITTAELIPGQHVFSATTRDAAGNVSSPASLVINIDTSAPAAPVITGYTNDTGTQGDGITSDTRPILNGTAEANATVNVTITKDGNPFTTAPVTANAQGAWSLQPPVALADGVYTISATATDAAGNTGPASTSASVTIDHTAPTATATLIEATDNVAPDGSTTEATVITSGGTSNDNSLTLHGALIGNLGDGEVVAIYDGATRLGTAAVKITDWTFNTNGLSDSLHSFSVRVEDAAGNQSASSAAYLVTVNTSVPTATVAITSVVDDVALITGDVASGGLTNDQQPLLSGSITGTLAAGEQVAVFDGTQRLGNATVSGDGTTWTFTPAAPLGQGSHSFTARVENVGGNPGTASAAHIVNVDSEAPAAPVVTPADVSPVTSGGGLYINNSQINVSGLETNATWQYTVNGGETWTNGSGSSFTLADGTYTSVVQVRQIDQAGNAGTPGVNAGDSLTVDTQAPTLQSATVNGNTVVLTFNQALNAHESANPDAYDVAVGSTLHIPVTDRVVSGDTVTLTLTRAVGHDDVVRISYTAPSAGDQFAVKDIAGNHAGGITSFTVSNATPTPADVIAPTFTSASVDGSILTMVYSEALNSVYKPANGSFTVLVEGVPNPVTFINVSGNSLSLTLTNPVVTGAGVTISYTDPTDANDPNAVQDTTGNDAGNLAATQVTNNTQPSQDTTGPTPTSATIDGSLLTIAFNEALDPAHQQSTSYMQVMVSGSGNISPRNIVGTQISGSDLLITLGTPVVSTDVVTISYKDPTTGNDVFAIQDVAGNDTDSVNSVSVINNTGTNTSQPNLVAASFSETANATVTLTFNEPMQGSQIGNLMLFKNGEGSNILTGVQGISGGAVTFTTSATLTATDHVVLSYFGGGDLRDMSGNYVSQNSLVIGGSGANAVDLENNINWSQFTNSITVRGNGGADHLIGSGNNDYIYAGGGTDIVNGGWGKDYLYLNETDRASDTVMIGTDGGTSSGSQPFFFDRVFGFDTTSAVEGAGNTNDVLNMASNTIATATEGFVNGSDVGSIRSHSIGAGGVLTFGSTDGGTPVLINETNISDATWYLEHNLTNPGDTVAFAFDMDNNGHADSLFVFQDGGGEDIDNDAMILLAGVNGATLGTVAGQNVVRLVDTTGPEINGGSMGSDAFSFFYNENIQASGPAGNGFTALLNGAGTNVITGGSIAGNTLTLQTSAPVANTDYLLVSYEAGVGLGTLGDSSGNLGESDLPGFALGGTGNNTIDLSLLSGSANYGIHDLGGSDTLIGNAGSNRMDGGDGDDILRGGDGNDELSGGTGADDLDGGAGVDEFSFTQGDSTPVAYNAAAGTYTFTGGADVITGGFDVLASNNDSWSGDSIHMRSGMPGNGVSAMGTWNQNTFVPSTPSDGLATDQQYFLQRGNYSAGVFMNNINGTDTLVVYDGNNLTGAVSQTALVIQGVNPTQLTATEWGDIYLSSAVDYSFDGVLADHFQTLFTSSPVSGVQASGVLAFDTQNQFVNGSGAEIGLVAGGVAPRYDQSWSTEITVMIPTNISGTAQSYDTYLESGLFVQFEAADGTLYYFSSGMHLGDTTQASRGYISEYAITPPNGIWTEQLSERDDPPTSDTSGRIGVSFDATTKVLTSYANGQYLWSIDIDAAGITDWNMIDSNTFQIGLGFYTSGWQVAAGQGPTVDDFHFGTHSTFVNHAPVITSNGGSNTAGISIAENTTAVTTAMASDANGDAVSWSIIGGADAGLFSVNTSTGALTFRSAPNFEMATDSGNNNVYDVIIQAVDGHGGSDSQAIAVTVTDVNEDAPPATIILGSGSTSLALINPTVLNGKVYYYVDRSGDGTNAGDDYFYHFEVDNLFNGGDDTVDSQPSGAVAGVDDARTYIAGDYTVVLPTQAELHALFAVEGSPTGWINGLYLSSTLESPGYHYRENTNGGAGLAADSAGNSLAVQVLFSGGGSGTDFTAPVFQSASIQGATLTLAYNEALDSAHLPSNSAFSVGVNGVAATVSSVAASGSSLLITLAAAVNSDDTVTFSYTDAAGDDVLTIQDVAGNDALSLSPTLVTNLTCYYIPSASLTVTEDAGLATISLVKFSGVDHADGYITTPPTAPNASAQETAFLAAVTTLGKDLRLYDFEDAASGNFAGSATAATYVPASGMTVSGQIGDISLGNAQGVLALDSYLATHLFCIGSTMGTPTAGNDPGIATNEGNDADRGYNVTAAGSQYLEVLPGDTSNGGVVVDFTGNVTGFGLTLMGRQDTKRDVYADIYLSNGDVVRQLTATHPYDQGGEQFLGYLHVPLAAVNYTIDKVVFYEPYAAGDTADERDIFALDDIYLVVPEGQGNLGTGGDTTAPYPVSASFVAGSNVYTAVFSEAMQVGTGNVPTLLLNGTTPITVTGNPVVTGNSIVVTTNTTFQADDYVLVSCAGGGIFKDLAGNSVVSGTRFVGGEGNNTIDASSIGISQWPVTLLGNGGDDTLTGTGSNDTLIGGEGADILNGSWGADVIILIENTQASDTVLTAADPWSRGSQPYYFDTVVGFDVTGTTTNDKLNLASGSIASNASHVDGADVGSLAQHSITSGILTFENAAGATVLINAGNLQSATDYLLDNLTQAGAAVGFAYDGDGNGTADSLFVFQNGGGSDFDNDTMVQLAGVNGVTLGNSAGLNVVQVVDTVGPSLVDGTFSASTLNLYFNEAVASEDFDSITLQKGNGGTLSNLSPTDTVITGNHIAVTLNNAGLTSNDYVLFTPGDRVHQSATDSFGNVRNLFNADEAGFAIGGDGDTVIDLSGQTGAFSLYDPHGGNDTLTGNDSDNEMEGGLGNDILRGGVGNDELNGGAGADNLDGGAGADQFSFTQGEGTGVSFSGGVYTFADGADVISGGFDVLASNNASQSGDYIDLRSTIPGSGLSSMVNPGNGTVTDQHYFLERGNYSNGVFTNNANGADTLVVYDGDGMSGATAQSAVVVQGVNPTQLTTNGWGDIYLSSNDTTAPLNTGASFNNAANASITLSYSEAVTADSPAGLSLSLNPNNSNNWQGTAITPSGTPTGLGSSTLVIPTTATLAAGDVVRMRYESGPGSLRDLAGNETASGEIFFGGSGNNTIDLSHYTPWTGFNLAIRGNGGNDTLTGTNDVDLIVDGGGADTLAGDFGADIIRLVENGADKAYARDVVMLGVGHSPSAGAPRSNSMGMDLDIILGSSTSPAGTGFDITSGTVANHDVLDLPSNVIAGTRTLAAGTVDGNTESSNYTGTIAQHSIAAGGIVSFATAAGTAIVIDGNNAGDAINYLDLNITGHGTVAFEVDTDNSGTTDALVVYQDAGHSSILNMDLPDTAVVLAGITGATLGTAAGMNVVQIQDTQAPEPVAFALTGDGVRFDFAENAFATTSLAFTLQKNGTGNALAPASIDGSGTSSLTIHYAGLTLADTDWAMLHSTGMDANTSISDAANNTLIEEDAAGFFMAWGGSGDNTIDLSSLSGGYDIDGFAGNDTLIGSTGNDYFTGGTGADTLTGGAGRDEYEFEQGDSPAVTARNLGSDGVLNNGDTFSFGNGVDRITDLVSGEGLGLDFKMSDLFGNAQAPTFMGQWVNGFLDKTPPANGQATDQGFFVVQGNYSGSTFTANSVGTDTLLVWDGDATNGVSQTGLVLSGVQVAQLQLGGNWIGMSTTSGFSNADDTYQLPTAPVVGQTIDVLGGSDTLLMPFYPTWIMPQGQGLHFGNVLVQSSLTTSDVIYTLSDNSATSYHLSGMHDLLVAQPVVDYDLNLNNFEHLRFVDGTDVLDIDLDQDIGQFDGSHAVAGVLNGNTLAANTLFASYDATATGVSQVIGGAALADTAGFTFAGINEIQMSKDESGTTPVWRFTENTSEVFSITQAGEDWAFDFASTGAGVDVTLRNIEYAAILNSVDDMLLRLSFVNAQPQVIL